MAPKTKIKPQVCSGFHMRARAGKKNITAAAAPDSSGSKSNNSSFPSSPANAQQHIKIVAESFGAATTSPCPDDQSDPVILSSPRDDGKQLQLDNVC